MPNAKVLEQKKAIVAELAARLKNASSGVLVDYRGINVANDTKLRRDMRAAGVKYEVVKNTLTKLAVREAGLEALEPLLEGTTSLAVSDNDPVAPAKLLADAVKKINEKKAPGKFSIKGGFVEGRAISAAEVIALSELPPREVLVARALAGFNAPISGLVNVLNGNIRGLAVALNAIAEKKGA